MRQRFETKTVHEPTTSSNATFPGDQTCSIFFIFLIPRGLANGMVEEVSSEGRFGLHFRPKNVPQMLPRVVKVRSVRPFRLQNCLRRPPAPLLGRPGAPRRLNLNRPVAFYIVLARPGGGPEALWGALGAALGALGAPFCAPGCVFEVSEAISAAIGHEAWK